MTKEQQQMEDVLNIQLQHGNWNWDPYMHGMVNGMILQYAILLGVDPEYKTAPVVWECQRMWYRRTITQVKIFVKYLPLQLYISFMKSAFNQIGITLYDDGTLNE